MKRRAADLLPAIAFAAFAAAPAMAQDRASGAAIKSAVSGNSMRGHMVASGSFEEYYDPSGAVRGADYSGNWTVSGDQLCLAYDGDPANCWGLQISGTAVIWVGRGGEEGTATIIPGNPKGF